jgi:hypothetical protein
VKLRTSDGQTFDAWVNSPENERAVPKWLGQIGVVSETRTEITAPDGSQLSIGPGDVVINEHGRLRSMGMRVAQRLFDLEESGEVSSGPQGILHPAQPENMGRARQGMVVADRGRLQPDDTVARELPDAGTGDPAGSAGDSGAAAAEQDGERAGESAGDTGPTEATATGGPGSVDPEDPVFGATGSDGGGETETEDKSGDAAADTGTEDGAVSPSPRRRGKK